MQLNSDGKLARFYMWMPPDDKRLPQDFCTYFWGLVYRAFAIFVVGGLMLVFLVCGIAIFLSYVARLVWTHKAPTLFILGFVAVMGFITWISERKKKLKIEVVSEAKMILKGKIDSIKKNYCPRVEWTTRDEPERDAETVQD